MTYSEEINSLVEKAVANGNSVLEVSTGWTKVREVVRMKEPLSDDIKDSLANNNRLRAWSVEGTPHNRAEDGYTDDVEKVAVTFPR